MSSHTCRFLFAILLPNKQPNTNIEGGMTLYVKASEDGTSVGDCPFAHFLRMVLEEKGLEYELRPTAPDAKPDWLNEYYEGKLPALRHRKECYVESGVIAEYVDFFFQDPSLKATSSQADEVLEGFFPAVAQYLKVDDDEENLTSLKLKLAEVNEHLSDGKEFLCGDSMSLLDCRLIPQLYHLQTGIEGFKEGVPDIATDYPHISAYYERMTARPSFQATTYPKEAILWGWGNARK
jgi:chloride intracellular channel protein 3